jgi:hypothetical protein
LQRSCSLHRGKTKGSDVHLLPSATLLLAAFLGAGPTAAQTIAERDCRRLERHVPAPDVAYRPGVDVRGRPVAPADLAPAPAIVPERLTIHLGVDLQRRLGLPRDLIADLPLGVIEIENDTVLFNGRPLGPDATAALAAACREARRR